jgi:hypothetical protein
MPRATALAVAFGLCSLALCAGCGGNVSGGKLVGSGGSGATGTGGSGATAAGGTGCGLCEPNGAECPQGCPIDGGGPPPLPCGNTTCATGTICCDVCGTDSCVPGNACPTGGSCVMDCSAQDAQGYGECDVLFGYRWNGASCVVVGGCGCQGGDCGKLFPDPQSCYQAYQPCSGDENACCSSDSACVANEECISGKCERKPPSYQCWRDSDCSFGTCSGASVCPCGPGGTCTQSPDRPGYCPVPDDAGTP